jgi:hypothetical protein
MIHEVTAMEDFLHSEFDLHIAKRLATADKPDQYLIGVWDGTTIRGLCYVADIDEAVAVFRRTLESAGCRTRLSQRR